MWQNAPCEDLNILLDVSGLRARKLHDELEEPLTILLSLGHGQGPEAFEIAPYHVLLLDREAHGDQRFQQVDTIDTCHKAFVPLRPPDAADADGACRPISLRDWPEGGVDCTPPLLPPELDQPPLVIPFLCGPVFRHVAQISLDLQYRLVRVNRVGIEAGRSTASRLAPVG